MAEHIVMGQIYFAYDTFLNFLTLGFGSFHGKLLTLDLRTLPQLELLMKNSGFENLQTPPPPPGEKLSWTTWNLDLGRMVQWCKTIFNPNLWVSRIFCYGLSQGVNQRLVKVCPWCGVGLLR